MTPYGEKVHKPADYAFDELYGERVLQKQVRKFLLRHHRDEEICHWFLRIELVERSLAALDLPAGARILDLGTQVGTFAIELARKGYAVTGLDLSPEAIAAAQGLARQVLPDGRVDFVVGDVADPAAAPRGEFHAIVAEDILEHLHEDVLRRALRNVFDWLRPGGYFLFHTCPTRYEHLFHATKLPLRWASVPLIPFAPLPDRTFERIVEWVHRDLFGPLWKAVTGEAWEGHLARQAHCNLLTRRELKRQLAESGLVDLYTEATNLYAEARRGWRGLVFGRQTCYQRNLHGVAWKPIPELAHLFGAAALDRRQPGAAVPAIAGPSPAIGGDAARTAPVQPDGARPTGS